VIARTTSLLILALLAACNHGHPTPSLHTAPSGFPYSERNGDQSTPPCPPDATVTVHVTIRLPDNTVIDTTRDVEPAQLAEHAIVRDRPMTFPLSDVPPGLRDLITGMRRNQTRLATIPPPLLYGGEGRPPRIPPNTPLTYSVTLLDFSTP